MRTMQCLAGLVAGVAMAAVGWACGASGSGIGGGVSFDRIFQSRASGHVVVYLPQNSPLDAANSDLSLADALQRAGHDVHVVRQAGELELMLVDRETELVLLDVADFARVNAARQARGSTAAILPIEYDPDNAASTAGPAQNRCAAHVTKLTGGKLIRAVDGIMLRRGRGLSFDCAEAAESPAA